MNVVTHARECGDVLTARIKVVALRVKVVTMLMGVVTVVINVGSADACGDHEHKIGDPC